MTKSTLQLEGEIADALSADVSVVRRLQREGARLRKRFLGPTRYAAEIRLRDAVQYANDCGWRNPSPGAITAQKNRWARRWLELYVSKGGVL